jgi:hypothetical protein
MQVGLDRGKGDLGDRHVEDDHELREREDGQGAPAARIGVGHAASPFRLRIIQCSNDPVIRAR